LFFLSFFTFKTAIFQEIKLCMHFSSPSQDMCPAYCNIWKFTALTVLSNSCKLWNSWLCNILNFPLAWSVLCLSIFPNTLFSSICNLCYYLMIAYYILQAHKTDGKIIFGAWWCGVIHGRLQCPRNSYYSVKKVAPKNRSILYSYLLVWCLF
jgi:hypothetical protein